MEFYKVYFIAVAAVLMSQKIQYFQKIQSLNFLKTL